MQDGPAKKISDFLYTHFFVHRPHFHEPTILTLPPFFGIFFENFR